MKTLLLTLLLLTQGLSPEISDDVTIVLNDEVVEFETPAYIIDGRTMVPIKFLINALGYDVYWNEITREVTCVRSTNEIVLTIDKPEIYINGETYISDVEPMIIHDRTYVPLALIGRVVGADINWIGETRTVTIDEKLEYFNMFYGPSSYPNYLKIEKDKIDSFAYAWSRITITDGIVKLNTTSLNNTMYIPSGHELAMDHGKTKLLNIYCDSDYDLVMLQTDNLIDQIKKQILSAEIDEPEFDGIVIDFENIPSEYYEAFEIFIENLDASIDTKIYLAVQPRTFNYKQLLSHVDYMILMLHDYEAKSDVIINFNKEYVNQPTAPVDKIIKDLDTIVNELTYSERAKILLQVNLSVVQWQGETLYEVTRYTPSYKTLYQRLLLLDEEHFFFDSESKQPYLLYSDENNLMNTIWYENESSIQAKLDLVKLYELGGISLWQMGNLPLDVDDYSLQLFNTIIDNY